MVDNLVHITKEVALTQIGDYHTSGILSLSPGRYRFFTRYRLLQNHGNERNLIEVMIADWNQGRIFHAVNVPGKELDVDGDELSLTQLDLRLDKTTELEFRITLLHQGETSVNEIGIMKKVEDLPKDPEVLFILDDRADPTGCVHQGISSMAAYLKERDVLSHALMTSTCDDEFIEEILQRYHYRYVAFSVVSEDSPRQLIDMVKRDSPDSQVVVGGPHVTIIGAQMLEENESIDIGVLGEGEQTFYEIVSGKSLEEIPGVVYRDNSSVISNEPRAFFESIADLPLILRDNYFNDDWAVHSLLTSRGCPYRCHFCSSSRIWGSKIRFRTLEHIEQELQWLYENGDHGLLIVINDDMFNLKKARTLELMKIFKRYPFSFYARGVRADRIDAEIAREMKAAGVNGCGIGIESADNESLRMMRKSETIEEIERGIEHLKTNGILVAGQFMIGNIGDTLETVEKSIEFAKRLDSALFYSARPYPGTPLTEYLVANGLLLKEPYTVFKDTPSTTVYFETPIFSLADRIEAIRKAYWAGLIYQIPN